MSTVLSTAFIIFHSDFRVQISDCCIVLSRSFFPIQMILFSTLFSLKHIETSYFFLHFFIHGSPTKQPPWSFPGHRGHRQDQPRPGRSSQSDGLEDLRPRDADDASGGSPQNPKTRNVKAAPPKSRDRPPVCLGKGDDDILKRNTRIIYKSSES